MKVRCRIEVRVRTEVRVRIEGRRGKVSGIRKRVGVKVSVTVEVRHREQLHPVLGLAARGLLRRAAPRRVLAFRLPPRCARRTGVRWSSQRGMRREPCGAGHQIGVGGQTATCKLAATAAATAASSRSARL